MIENDKLLQLVYSFSKWYDKNYRSLCADHLGMVPQRIDEIWNQSLSLTDKLNDIGRYNKNGFLRSQSNEPPSFSEENYAMAKRVILFERERKARSVYARVDKTTDAETRTAIENELTELDTILSDATYAQVTPIEIPSISDYLNTLITKDFTWFGNEWKELDQKFGLMQSGSYLYSLLDEIKTKCALEKAPITCAFFDIDNFKSVNTEYTEQVVDRVILPRFMTHMVSIFKWHSFLFRIGGDEYFVIIPYLRPKIAKELLLEYQNSLSEQTFGSNGNKITVSIGAVHFNGASSKCASEIIQAANDMKQSAKQTKNTIKECLIND